MKKLLVYIIFVLLASPAMAQVSDQQLAAHYFNRGEFDKAVIYYEKLYEKNRTDYYYGFYLKSLIELKEFKKAEKLVKQQIKRHSLKLGYRVDLGEVYEAQGEMNKALGEYEEAIEDLPPNTRAIIDLGNSFRQKGKLDLALQTFRKGQKLIKNYPFNMYVAEIYGKQGRIEAMIDEYLDVLERYDSYMVRIQNTLVNMLDFEEKNDPQVRLLKESLLKRIQKNPNSTIYTEMLIWYYVQRKEFNMALIQTKALDRRRDGNGEEVMYLSRMCASNRYYDVAIKGYEYIVDKFPNGFHYNRAKMELLSVLYSKVTNSEYTQDDLVNLEQRYKKTLSSEELGRNSTTVPLMRELAHIEAFYLHHTDEAIALLEEAINMPGISSHLQGKCKLDLGDILVLTGDIWEASLYYMQVEKKFKEDVLGHEAKFRNAKIYYYTGQFEWAQGQLDVLKASTSKLISNDAMDLSLLITDNLNLDTTIKPMMLFAKADLLAFQNRFDEALNKLDSINSQWPWHNLNDEILFQRYEIARKQSKFDEAIRYLGAIVESHGDDILADDALFLLGDLHQYHYRDLEKAKEYYKTIMFEHTASLYVVEARKRFRALGGKSETEDDGGFKKIEKEPKGDLP